MTQQNFITGYILIKTLKTKNTNSKRYKHLTVHSSIIYNCQDMKANLSVCPLTDEWTEI